jgi:hypothetical protein
MEKGPNIRIIGDASDEHERQAKEEVNQALFDHLSSFSPEEQRELNKLEYPKSEKEIAFIRFAKEVTSRLMKEAGVEPYDIPIENFHIIPPELYKRMTGGSSGEASSSLIRQGILLNADHLRDGNPVNFIIALIHELMHLKAHLTLEVREKDGELRKTIYREGVSIRALQQHRDKDKYHEHFAGLHEAIVAEVEKKFLGEILNLPELAEEKEWLNSDEAKEMIQKLAQEKGLSEDEIFWVDKEGNWKAVSYPRHREVLDYVCAEIQKQFPDEYQSADDVFKVFLHAHFTGHLPSIGHLVEKTFGEGSFRLLGNMEINDESGVLCLESLQKARARQKKLVGGPQQL